MPFGKDATTDSDPNAASGKSLEVSLDCFTALNTCDSSYTTTHATYTHTLSIDLSIYLPVSI